MQRSDRVVRAIGVMVMLASAAAGAQPGELIERTLAIVGGQPITLADARSAVALGLINDVSDGASPQTATSKLIDRALILREVQRYAPPEPGERAIDERARAVRARFAAPEAFQLALDIGGFTEARLRAWIRDDLRIAAYLDQRFAVAGTPSEDEIAAYYAQHREEFARAGVGLPEATAAIRARLIGERRKDLIADWLSDLRRRTPVVEIKEMGR